MEEAKSLLHHSDRTISEISEYLCFSSQSYFQNVFKAKYGMTPKEFRQSKSSPEH
ncbi:helix-turn-helix domain-containing protein [Butyrivibrio sp. VCD2006]|uniref:helix-turn-helix domain-containing protein n=1 Tax=Butyrivibrio sp. VCD2006 TaxID=1280664 RepID=UPI0009DB8114